MDYEYYKLRIYRYKFHSPVAINVGKVSLSKELFIDSHTRIDWYLCETGLVYDIFSMLGNFD